MLFNPDIERMPLPHLRALQTARLKEPVAYVYDHVPFYRQKSNALEGHPATFWGLEDLTKLGFTRKTDFRDNYFLGLLAVPEKVARLHCSSGTVVGCLVDNLKIFAEPTATAQRRQQPKPRARFAPAGRLYELIEPVV